jgi:hypothetical protein
VKDRLETFLAATSGDSGESITLRALTLHMLAQVAPRLFEQRKLKATWDRALEACRYVEFDFSGDRVQLQCGVDAWYCRFLEGLPHVPPSAERLGDVLRTLANGRYPFTPTLSPPGEREHSLLYAWLMGEQAARCGVDVRVPMQPRPFKGTHPLHDAYWLTHLVMLDTDYFAKPLSHPDAQAWGDELSALVPSHADLAGEVALCLRFMKRDASGALELVRDAPVTEDAHAQATALLALSAE